MQTGQRSPHAETAVHPGEDRHGMVLLAAAGATFLAFLDATVVNIAFPALQKEFSTSSLADLSWVLTSYGILFAALLTPAGRLADVLGRRKLFNLSVIVFSVASVLSAVAPNLEFLIASRVLQGAGAAGMIPSALGLVLGHTPPARRMIAVGLWAGAGSLAAAAGPSIGGLLIEWTNWRSVFFINVPLGLALVWVTYRNVPADAPSGRRIPDPIGTIFVTIGISLAVLGLTKGADWGWTNIKTVGSLSGGAVLMAWSIIRSVKHPAPAVETSLWRSRIFAVTNLTSVFAGAAVFAWLLLGPVFLTYAWNYSVLKAGLAISPGALFSAVAAVIVGRRASARGQRIAVVAGSLLFAATAAWFYTQIETQPEYLSVFLPANIVSGVAISAVLTALSGAAAASLPPDRFAAGTGLLITARQMGGAFGIAAMAAILTAGRLHPFDAMLDVALFCGIAAAVAAASGLALLERQAATASA